MDDRNKTKNAFEVENKSRSKSFKIKIKTKNGEIETREHPLPEKNVFDQYKDLEIIAGEIVQELLSEDIYKEDVHLSEKGYKEIIEEGLTFFMSSQYKTKHSGLLSICPAVLTAMSIWKKLPPKSHYRDKLFETIKAGITAILKIIYRNKEPSLNDNEPVFDASPYETGAFTKGLDGKSYIDSISWAIPVFLRILNLSEKKDDKEVPVFTDKNLRKQAEFLAMWCLKYVNECMVSYIDEDEKDDNGKPKKYLGWSFTKLDNNEDAERSLYFTYAVSTIYLSFFAEYQKIIISLRTIEREMKREKELKEKKNKEGYIDGDDDLRLKLGELGEKYWDNKNGLEDKKRDIEKYINDKERDLKNNEKKEQETAEALEDSQLEDSKEEITKKNISKEGEKLRDDISRLEGIKDALNTLTNPDYTERIETFANFNEGSRILDEEKGQLSILKKHLEDVSEEIWGNIEDKLEETFFYEDIRATTATKEAIENGGQTNALFTGLLQIGVILNCGYDLKIRNEKYEKKEEGEKEYQKMQDAMLLHVQKTQRFFDNLEDNDKAFGADSLILRFTEKISEENNKEMGPDRTLAERLRKHYIRVCSLTPLLLKTNHLLSKYVVQYPQKQMGESLDRIDQKRFVDKSKGKKKYRWFWETDAYHAISNYYYVGAISDFYEYYNDYERYYVEKYEKIIEALKDDLNFTEAVQLHRQEIENKIKDKEKEFDKKLKIKEEEINALREEKEKSDIGKEIVANINQVISNSTCFEDQEFLKKIVVGIRKQLAKELVARYEISGEKQEDLEKLTKPLEPKDDTLFSLLQALATDIILPSAIDANKEDESEILKGLQETTPAKYAFNRGGQLINGGLIGKIFAKMFKDFNWKSEKNK
ncbi:hypothetical protein R84B8_03243 [Treponema sp. R8-4-B8]